MGNMMVIINYGVLKLSLVFSLVFECTTVVKLMITALVL